MRVELCIIGGQGARLEELAKKANMSPERYCETVLDIWITEHRPGRVNDNLANARNPDPLLEEA